MAKTVLIADAIRDGLVKVAASARYADGVQIVVAEDNGDFSPITIGDNVIVRAGVIICSGSTFHPKSVIGHNTVVRAGVSIGASSVISHMVVLERGTSIGANCRISSLTHLTGKVLVEDDVQIGARVVTVNDNNFRWRRTPHLQAPIFRSGARVGSGVTILGGVTIGHSAVIGAGSVVTKSIPDGVLALGVPAYVQRTVTDLDPAQFFDL